jgi:2'-5' RNA ligase
MIRLFVALTFPDQVADGLLMLESGVPGARWSSREQLHLTLRFVGDVDEGVASAVDDALAAIHAPRLSLELKGVGEFGDKTPRALWAGVRDGAAVAHLQRKIETALQRIGLEPEPRKFRPHVTLARLRGTSRGHVLDFLADHALYASPAFAVDAFILFSSHLSSHGSLYCAERVYALE